MADLSKGTLIRILNLTVYTAVAIPTWLFDHGAAAGPIKMGFAFQEWAKSNNVANASMMVTAFGRPARTWTVGNWNVDTVAHIASTSKAITAVCMMTLIDGGRLRFDSTLGQVLPRTINGLAARYRPVAGAIRIDQLLRHQSGINYDPTQQSATFAPVAKAADGDATLANLALNQPVAASDTTYFYNNINYSLLGLVIQTITHETYEEYCRRTVLAPRGATNASIGPGVRGMAAFGGWRMSAHSYSNFYAHAFNPQTFGISQAAHNFLVAGKIDITSDRKLVTYGLGTVVFLTRPGGGPEGVSRNLWHHGDWKSTATTPQEFASYAAYWENSIAAVVTYDRHLPNASQRDALHKVLEAAAFATD